MAGRAEGKKRIDPEGPEVFGLDKLWSHRAAAFEIHDLVLVVERDLVGRRLIQEGEVVVVEPVVSRPEQGVVNKNDLEIEICGSKAALKWRQEHQNELLIGHRDRPNEILQKDPSLIDDVARRYAHLPGGHQESWADAFSNLMRDIYGFIAEGKKASDPHPPAFATFEDGYRANCIVEAILQSASNGSAWTKVNY